MIEIGKGMGLWKLSSFGFKLFVFNYLATCTLLTVLAVLSNSVALVVMSAIIVFCVFVFVEIDEVWEKISAWRTKK